MRKNSFSLLIATALAVLLLASCSSTSLPSEQRSQDPAESASVPADVSAYPAVITDFLGYTSTIESADTIVSLAPSCTEVLIAEGAADRIVAADASSLELLPDAESAGSYTDPDIEKITALKPDLVIAANYIQNDAIERLRSLGLTVIAAEPSTWDEVPESFEMIGAATGRKEAGTELVQKFDETVAEVHQKAPKDPVSCYYVLSYGNAGNWTSGEGSFINTMLTYAGGDPITANTASTWLEYPMEDLAAHDPECIILASGAGSINDFINTPGYSDLRAVRNGNVYGIDETLVSVPGPSLTDGLVALSEIFRECAGRDAEAA